MLSGGSRGCALGWLPWVCSRWDLATLIRVRVDWTERTQGAAKGLDVKAINIHSATGDDRTTTVQFLDSTGLRGVLFAEGHSRGSVLQKFIPSKGEHHTVVRATWSPQVRWPQPSRIRAVACSR